MAHVGLCVCLFALCAALPHPPRVGVRRDDGLLTIAEALGDNGLDDGAIYHPEWFTEAPIGSPSTAQGYFLKAEAENEGAVCLDGTPSAYYHRAGTGSGADKWYIHQQGGGWCYNLDECWSRALTDLGSSKAYPPTSELTGGYFDINATINPQMYNWNMVFMRYCDGNSFSGANASTTFVKNMTLHWRGRYILDAQISSLLNERGLSKATDIVVSGCSAGGLATFLHCDHWAERISEAGSRAKVACMPDRYCAIGFFLDYEGPPKYHSSMTWAFEQQNSSSGVNSACIRAHSTETMSQCMFAQHTAPYIRTPIFPLQSAYDSWQVANDLGAKDPATVNAWGKTLTSLVESSLLINPQHGIFLDSCYHHCGMWGKIRIDGDVQATAFQAWYLNGSQRLANKGFFNQNKSYVCEACCSP